MGQISATTQPDNTIRKLMGKNSDTLLTVCFMYVHIDLAVTETSSPLSAQSPGFRTTSWLPWSPVNIRPLLLSQEAWPRSAGS